MPAGAPVIVEIYAPSQDPKDGGPGGVTAIQVNEGPADSPTYFRSSACGHPNFGDIEPLLPFSAQAVMRIDGEWAPRSRCSADLEGDATVDGADLGALLAGWGSAGDSDLNGDGTTDGADLGALLAAWGACR